MNMFDMFEQGKAVIRLQPSSTCQEEFSLKTSHASLNKCILCIHTFDITAKESTAQNLKKKIPKLEGSITILH